jgi:hypothetical protein
MSLMAFARGIHGKPFATRSAADRISSVEYVPLKTRISIALGNVRVGSSFFGSYLDGLPIISVL